MIRTLFFASLLGGIVALTSASAGAETPEPVPVPPPPVDFNALPWTDGETLTYLVSMDSLEAAQGTFVAKKKNDHWEFNLALASRGLVNEVYPFSTTYATARTRHPLLHRRHPCAPQQDHRQRDRFARSHHRLISNRSSSPPTPALLHLKGGAEGFLYLTASQQFLQPSQLPPKPRPDHGGELPGRDDRHHRHHRPYRCTNDSPPACTSRSRASSAPSRTIRSKCRPPSLSSPWSGARNTPISSSASLLPETTLTAPPHDRH
jgi:hypothetical protein